MNCCLLLNVVVGHASSIFQLLSGVDKSLLVRRDSFLFLDLGLDVFDCVGSFDFEGDGLASEGLDEDLLASSESENEVDGVLLLQVVVCDSAPVLQLFACEDKSLLVGGNSFLLVDLCLEVLDRVGWFDIKSDCFTRKSFHENLHVVCFKL